MTFYLSTVADLGETGADSTPLHTARTAANYGLGLELAEFCISDNLDDGLERTHRAVLDKLALAPAAVLHAPFNELYPSAIDPRAAALVTLRFSQALERARAYGIKRLVVHGGFVPTIYYRPWFVERSISFWKDFLGSHPGDELFCLENVMEDTPDLLLQVVEGVDSPRLKLCLDVGHANVVSKFTPMEWLERFAPRLAHLHIHNNAGALDTHNTPDDGIIDLLPLLHRCQALCPDATCTLECMDTERAASWLMAHDLIPERTVPV